MTTIGEVLRKKRLDRGETLEAVALRAGTDTGNLSRVEQNKQRPSLDLLEHLAEALETPVSVLFYKAEGHDTDNLGEQAAGSDYNDSDLSRLLRYWRSLTPGNRRMAVEIIKVMSKSQREVSAPSPGTAAE